ncbi:MAG: helix-turn-helix domain-containing protein [Clostridiales bacterium]|nr:helix-turn-helix domain-containing protein [Clostridiales bacterium]
MQTGKIIADLRMRADLTQQELSEKLYVSKDLVSKWETGKSRPDHRTVLKMAEIFSVDPEMIVKTSDIMFYELSECFPQGAEIDFEKLGTVLNSFLGTLNERDRSVFVRRYYYMENTGEIGEKYGISDAYVRTVLMRIRKKLKKYFREVRL